MGQKVNPKIFRKEVPFTWYSLKHFDKLLHEDLQIIKYIETTLKNTQGQNYLLKDCQINRGVRYCIVKLKIWNNNNSTTPLNWVNISKTIQDLTKSKLCLIINIDQPMLDKINSKILAELIAKRIENRKPFRDLITELVKSPRSKYAGLKILCSGRLNGVEMAKTQIIKIGRIPLQTISANVDYGFAQAYTKFGVIGIKVWIN
jgi:small subunit ribosomal protein S3